MSKQEIRIYALPTNKASCIRKLKGSNQFQYFDKPVLKYGEYAETHYLYATTSETPKKEDWCIGNDFGENLHQCTIEANCKAIGCRKVVATDNSELHYKGVFNEKLQRRTFGDVPQISPEFKQAWVREANKSTPIVEAMIEMDIIYTLNERFTLDNLDEAEFVNQTEVENEHGTVFPASYLSKVELEFAPKSYQPKLNPQGYVTILPVKEKMYTKEEIINFLYRFKEEVPLGSNSEFAKKYSDMSFEDRQKQWVKENL